MVRGQQDHGLPSGTHRPTQIAGIRHPSCGDPAAGPLWGRFYDLEKCEIYVCDRDGIPRKSLEEIGHERRNGYSWYNDNPLSLYPVYDKWADLNDPDGKVRIDMSLVNKAEARGQKRR